MTQATRIRLYVFAVAALGFGCGVYAFFSREPFPGWWPVVSFVFVATLLEGLRTDLRVSANGSTSFIIHLACAPLFGAFWGGLIAAVSTLFGELARGNTPMKVFFNVSQRVLAVVVAVWAYQSVGGSIPPAFLDVQDRLASSAVQRDIGLFFGLAFVYFAVNSIAVSAVVSLSSNRPLSEVWYLNTRGVLGYDLGASALALIVAWWYTFVDRQIGFGSVGLIGAIIPIVAVRHVYALYHQLQENGQELLQVMVKAIEARDPYTSGHSLRVRDLSRAIALELGLSPKDVEQVETAALLHDVGKIHEEFAPLLRKEARLTDEETAIMQTHALRSAELVGIISKFRGTIQEAVRHHHERWDGAGYPTGLAGTTIPLPSRIILISDTIDAMTTDRPYRKRLGLDVVVAELQRCKGTQFDPQLVDVTVNSVAVRRLIAGAPQTTSFDQSLGRSRKVNWPASSLWRTRRA